MHPSIHRPKVSPPDCRTVSTYFGRRSDLLRLTAMQRSYRFSNSAARVSTPLLLPLATILLFSFSLMAQPGDEGQYLNRATEKLKRLDAQISKTPNDPDLYF